MMPHNDMAAKVYISRFMAGEKIDLPNYLTEILIDNYLKWLKQPIPNCAFWRKSVVVKSPEFRKLSQKYIAELSEIRKLLKKYPSEILAQYFLSNKCIGVKIIKKEFKEKIISDLDDMAKKYVMYKGVVVKTETVFVDPNPEPPIEISIRSFPTNKNCKINL